MTRSGLFAGIAVMFCLLLLGCSDSGSGTEKNIEMGRCDVVSKKPLLIESYSGGVFARTSLNYKDDRVIQLVNFNSADAAQKACPEYEGDSDYETVKCEGKNILAIGKEGMTLSEYEDLIRQFVAMCGDSIEFDDISSSSESDLDEIKESSSSEGSYWEEESSSSEKTPWNDDLSSSSKKTPKVDDSSSSSESSSSEENTWPYEDESSSSNDVSSSSENLGDEVVAWYTISSYVKKNVVADNAAELNCADNTDMTELDGYDVAYEFNNPNNLGQDYVGNHNAYLDTKVESVSAECGSLVLDGTNGLLVPLDDIFMSRGFVVEVRFMPTDDADIGNIFVAEPPGSGVDGWQIRMDNGTDIYFHARDTEVSSGWQVLNVSDSTGVGPMTLNEWHTIRVKIFPTKSGLGDIFYTLNIVLDGAGYAVEFKGNMSDIEYGLGIGYDAMHQSAYSRKFFTGKIDYIRYGKITEDGL